MHRRRLRRIERRTRGCRSSERTLMHRLLQRLCVVLACSLGLGGAQAFDDPPGPGALLNDLSTASARLNYSGVVVYQRGNALQTLRVIHRGRPGPEAERIITLDGPAREVVRDGAQVQCIYADDADANLAQSAPANPLRLARDLNLDAINAHYAMETIGESRLAGRDTFVVAITPLAPIRYGYQLWIDQETRFLLMSEVIEPGGSVLERTRFSEIRFPSDIPDAELEPRLKQRLTLPEAVDAGNMADATDTDAWRTEWLPPGFAMREASMTNLGMAAMPVSHQVYGDGLAMVSVFVERLHEGAASGTEIGFASVGAMNAVSRVEKGHKVTVVGELPRTTITRIAASVHQRR